MEWMVMGDGGNRWYVCQYVLLYATRITIDDTLHSVYMRVNLSCARFLYIVDTSLMLWKRMIDSVVRVKKMDACRHRRKEKWATSVRTYDPPR